MALKHKITINVTYSTGNKTTVLKGAQMKLPSRIIKFLFGDFKQIYLLEVGQTVESVDVTEVKEGGKEYEPSPITT